MANDNQNNFHWKNKLEDADSLFSETLPDKNNAWEKLHTRLYKTPRRKGLVWYWVAAACLLLAVIIPAITINKKHDIIVKNTPAKTEAIKKIVPEISTPEENENVQIAPALIGKKSNLQQTISPGEIKPAATNILQNQETVITNSTDEKIIKEEPIVSSVPVIDTTISMALVTPAKKKIKVVHINELGDVIEVSPDIAHNTDLHAFQLKLATQEVYRNPSVASVKDGFPIIKKKPSAN